MSGAPRVSVVVPVYNVERYLPEAMGSMRAQTFTNFEVVCVDDGSTDGSPRILADLAAADPRFRVTRVDNGGPSRARNIAMDLARGDITCFMDADDRMDPAMLQTVVDGFDRTGCDALVFGARPFPPEADTPWLERCLSPRDTVYRGFSPALLFDEATVPFTWRSAFSTAFLNDRGIRYDEDLAYGEDLAFLFKALSRSNVTALSSAKLYGYRADRPGSAMRDVEASPEARTRYHLAVVDRVLRDWESDPALRPWDGDVLAWTVEFCAYVILCLPQDLRDPLGERYADTVRPFLDGRPLKSLSMDGASRAVIAALTKDRRVGDLEAAALRMRYLASDGRLLQVVREKAGSR